MYMRKVLAVFIFVSCSAVVHAAVTVGSCEPAKHSYATISQAIAAAPVNEVVDVCPGTYPEQLTITKPLTIRGVQSGVNIVPPAAGLVALPANSGSYPQIFVSADGPVALSNLSVNGSTGPGIQMPFGVVSLSVACIDGFMTDYSGVYFLNTPGAVEHLNVSGYYVSNFSPDDPVPQTVPNCGNGIEFHGSREAVVRNTVIGTTGQYGIYSTGFLVADHNIVTGGFGPHGVGISSGRGSVITDNSVTGTLLFIETVGIAGGDLVRGNVVQSSLIGISGANVARHNTALNNAVGISGAEEVSDNMISAPSTYTNPACVSGFDCDLPTVGVDAACGSIRAVRENGIVGTGIGFANVSSGEKISPTNLLENVTTTSTACSQ
jgi:hypothetical protein